MTGTASLFREQVCFLTPHVVADAPLSASPRRTAIIRPILVSGFALWGSVDENPTALVIDRLKASAAPGLVAMTLPVESASTATMVKTTFSRHDPVLWIGLGLATGSATSAVERFASNLRDFAELDVTASSSVVPAVPPTMPP